MKSIANIARITDQLRLKCHIAASPTGQQFATVRSPLGEVFCSSLPSGFAHTPETVMSSLFHMVASATRPLIETAALAGVGNKLAGQAQDVAKFARLRAHASIGTSGLRVIDRAVWDSKALDSSDPDLRGRMLAADVPHRGPRGPRTSCSLKAA